MCRYAAYQADRASLTKALSLVQEEKDAAEARAEAAGVAEAEMEAAGRVEAEGRREAEAALAVAVKDARTFAGALAPARSLVPTDLLPSPPSGVCGTCTARPQNRQRHFAWSAMAWRGEWRH